MAIRGIRGATTCSNSGESVLKASRELLMEILQANPSMVTDDIASVFFTVTSDLQIAYPAKAARQLGWTEVPLICAREIDVPDGLPRCIRILLHWNTDLKQNEVRHVYLHEAFQLRPDLSYESQ